MTKSYTNSFQTGKTQTRILVRGRWLTPGRARELARHIVLGLSRQAGRASRENIQRALG